MTNRRQPIVAVLGHVDHGKTSLLDHVRSLGVERQASVMAREAGGITQHIGATEVPADLLNELCSPLMGGKEFESPGLLFIDTPGHHSFSTLRARGGSLADIAILVIDIMEGCQPQTLESLRVLRQARTPFVIAANKVDRIYGWDSEEGRSMGHSLRHQTKEVQSLFNKRFYELVGEFASEGFNLERYDEIEDFTQCVALVPCSAKEGEGIQDLLAVVIGLAERYLAEQLADVEGSAEATVLEMKEERGLGKTLDIILHRGTLSKGDEIALATSDGPRITRIRGMFSPRGMSEMRDAGNRWDAIEEVSAAAGLKLSAPDLEGVLAGTTLRALPDDDSRDDVLSAVSSECEISVQLDEEGVVIKADTLGGLEALASELREREIPVRHAGIGPVNKRDFRAAESAAEPLQQVILTFNTYVLPEVEAELAGEDCEVKHIGSEIIYHTLEKFEEWQEIRGAELQESQREQLIHPGRILVLKDHTFRRNNPAVVGIRVLAGRIHVGQRLLKQDGQRLGQVKSIRSGEQSLKESQQGDEVAISVNGVTVGRHFDEEDVLLVDIPAAHVRPLQKGGSLTDPEIEVLDELIELHRSGKVNVKDSTFWGL